MFHASARLRSRGQEASFGYLLLGVYYRRIPGSTLSVSNFCYFLPCFFTKLWTRLGQPSFMNINLKNFQSLLRSFFNKITFSLGLLDSAEQG
jgi:hypothetical protein